MNSSEGLEKDLCVVPLFNSETLFSVFLFCIVYIFEFLSHL